MSSSWAADGRAAAVIPAPEVVARVLDDHRELMEALHCSRRDSVCGDDIEECSVKHCDKTCPARCIRTVWVEIAEITVCPTAITSSSVSGE